MYEMINIVTALLGGLGLGSLLTVLMKERFDKRKFLYQEKEKIYAGYLEALAVVISTGAKEDKQKVVYWTTRLKLLAPEEIVTVAMLFFEKESRGLEFTRLRERLVSLMRADLEKVL